MPPPTRGYFASKITRAISARLLQLNPLRNIPPTRKCWFLYMKKISISFFSGAMPNQSWPGEEGKEERYDMTDEGWKRRTGRDYLRRAVRSRGDFALFLFDGRCRGEGSRRIDRDKVGPPAAEGTERDDITLCWNIFATELYFVETSEILTEVITFLVSERKLT